MVVEVKAKLVTVRVYEKKDGSKGLTDIGLLTDETNDYQLSGKVVKPYISGDTYTGPFDFSDFRRFEPVIVKLDISTFNGQESYKLLNLIKVENKK